MLSVARCAVTLLTLQFTLQWGVVQGQSFAPIKLVAIGVPVASHWFQLEAIIEGVLARGHQVKIIMTKEIVQKHMQSLQSHPNATVETYEVAMDEYDIRKLITHANRATGTSTIAESFGLPAHSASLLEDEQLHQKIKDFSPDLLLCDIILLGGCALADKLDIPRATLSVGGRLPPISNYDEGAGSHLLASVPQWNVLYPRHMTFPQRLVNLGGFLANMLVWTQVIQPAADKSYWLRHNIAPYSMLQSNRKACLSLLTCDWALTNPEPLSPHTVAIGAITAKPAKPLPTDLENFVQSAGDHGVVYASLGTSAIPDLFELRAVLAGLSAISPTKVIWKLALSDLRAIGNDSLPVGDNVKIVQWAPQNDLLGHPKTKAFFTQGGTNSYNEAGYHGVPIVGMPLFGEQPDNIACAIDRGFALSVSVHKLNTLAADLTHALHRVLHEPEFATSAARISRLMQSYRWTPAEIAASAIEHAAWTQGDRHLQTWRHDLNWFQMMSFDVILTALGLLFILGVVLLLVLRLIVRKLVPLLSQRMSASSVTAKKVK